MELKEGVGFLSSKVISINASCNKGGYVPGEPILVSLEIDNRSDKDISEIKVVLEEVSFSKCLITSTIDYCLGCFIFLPL